MGIKGMEIGYGIYDPLGKKKKILCLNFAI
jgi:hypothetical protein